MPRGKKKEKTEESKSETPGKRGICMAEKAMPGDKCWINTGGDEPCYATALEEINKGDVVSVSANNNATVLERVNKNGDSDK
jgi:hypothetical protein